MAATLLAVPPTASFETQRRAEEAVQPPAQQLEALQNLILPHIESFNTLFRGGLAHALADVDPAEVVDAHGNRMRFWAEELLVGRPMLPQRAAAGGSPLLYPSECRERGTTYKATMQLKVCYTVNNGPVQEDIKHVGGLPIMVKSDRCNLRGMSPVDMARHHEDNEELGGYFVVNGIERLIRLLIVPRRHHVMAITRPSFAKRGPAYSSFGCSIRCVRPDQSAQTITVHYLHDGDTTLRFSLRKREYSIPVVLLLKAFTDATDRDIYDDIVQDDHQKTFLTERIEAMLRKAHRFQLFTRTQTLAFLGGRFASALSAPESSTDVQLGELLLRRVLFVHLTSNRDKYQLLVHMVQKLYALASGECLPDNPDSPINHEILLPGHLIQFYLKEKVADWIGTVRDTLNLEIRRHKATDLRDVTHWRKALTKVSSDLGRKIEYFLATGNLVSNTGLDLQQVSGYTIVGEKLNFLRYLSHFRSVHRGAFFAEIRTTTVRKLLPDSWGFLCPVHTPDGAPCGLLNHLTHVCQVVTETVDPAPLPALLASLGMAPALLHAHAPAGTVPVLLDGRVIGRVPAASASAIAAQLRRLKIKEALGVPRLLEIACVPVAAAGAYPGLLLFSSPARMMRPVVHLGTGAVEMLGSFEQAYMEIAVLRKEIVPSRTTHVEAAPTHILSVIANITPFSDFNQSPRNMYQCQMGKQSMGTPTHSFPYRTDNKLYRLLFPQTPIVRPTLYQHYGFDNYPNGMNAVVAVIAYTGYDMEDAMIISKSSYERGFGHGCIYKTEMIDLGELRQRGEPILHRFGLLDRRAADGKLDLDGLPFVGARLQDGDPFYSVINETTHTARIERYKGADAAYVEEVRLIGSDAGDEELQRVCIKLRLPRNPLIGDKFSSRHGQKGVLSVKWPTVDMPFSERGLVPDVIINPNAFPSRMTIGMLVESMAGKSGALHGICQDATPFRFGETHRAVDFFGEQLLQAGYNYYGNEPMYSGITGTEFHADIYFGVRAGTVMRQVVYYQRLRHMVSDKFQVRTTGPVHNLTQQPVKGRKRAGGIRFGEMERDSLLAHGVSFMLQDRLMNCSDYSHTHVCRQCGSIISPISAPATSLTPQRAITCRSCQTGRHIEIVAIPYVFRYLVTELLAMNVKLVLDVN